MTSRLIAIAALVATTGCQDFLKAISHDSSPIDNRSAYSNRLFLYTWSQTEAYAQTDVPLDGILVTIYESAGEFLDACRDVERLGCSSPTNIDILGSEGTSVVDVGTEFAHQLGHAHFSQTDDKGDGRHAHAEWFGEGGVVDQVRALLIGEVGQ